MGHFISVENFKEIAVINELLLYLVKQLLDSCILHYISVKLKPKQGFKQIDISIK